MDKGDPALTMQERQHSEDRINLVTDRFPQLLCEPEQLHKPQSPAWRLLCVKDKNF